MDSRSLFDNNSRESLLRRQSNYPVVNCSYQLGTPDDARNETFWDMVKNVYCPLFASKSFTFSITIMQISWFLVSVFYDYNSIYFFRPTDNSLEDLGERNTILLKEFQIWRFVTPILLHANLNHLCYNLIMQMILGFRLEPTIGIRKMILIYFLCAFGGNLLGVIVNPYSQAVGASTAIMGLISAMISWIIMNWKSLEGNQFRLISLIMLVMILFFSLVGGLVKFI